MFKREAKQFCLNTALHGYKFIVLPKRMLLERYVWLFICLISFVTALSLVYIAWTDFNNDPIVTVTDSNHYPIWHYSFPAVTLCENNKISRTQARKLAKELNGPSNYQDTFNQFKDFIYLIHFNYYNPKLTENLTSLQMLLEQKNIRTEDALYRLTNKCKNILTKCVWKGEEKRCDSIFEPIKTTHGFCCTFNSFAFRNHTFKGSMAYKSPKEPRRVSACGYTTSLEVLIDNSPNNYFSSIIPSAGYQILIHNPYDYPDWNSQFSLIRLKTVNFLGINPRQTFCTEDVTKVSASKRNCWFTNEKQLIYFSKYSFHNCMVECRMNLTLSLCKCVPFFYIPDDAQYHHARICNLQDIPCLYNNADSILSSEPGFNSSTAEIDLKNIQTRGCNCLPDCEFTDYTLENSYGALYRDFSMNHRTLYGGVNLVNHSVFRVFFNDLVGVKNRRDLRFNWHTLLAFYGGLLGLFMGFSFVSAIEVIYFFIIRPFTNRFKKKSDKNLVFNKIQHHHHYHYH